MTFAPETNKKSKKFAFKMFFKVDSPLYDPLPTSGKGFTADYLRLSKVKITFCGF